MYQKDFILRMIEMFGELLAGIMALINKKEYKKAQEKIGRLYSDILREDAAYFDNLDATKLTSELIDSHNYTNGHLEILAELLNAEAELNFAQGLNEKALTYSVKSLYIFEYIDAEQKTYSLERINKIETIRKRIDILSKADN
jgi:hypothetical protein